jgi:hypothetical protein
MIDHGEIPEFVIASEAKRQRSNLSFRGDAKHRTSDVQLHIGNLEIPGLVLTHHPGMKE